MPDLKAYQILQWARGGTRKEWRLRPFSPAPPGTPAQSAATQACIVKHCLTRAGFSAVDPSVHKSEHPDLVGIFQFQTWSQFRFDLFIICMDIVIFFQKKEKDHHNFLENNEQLYDKCETQVFPSLTKCLCWWNTVASSLLCSSAFYILQAFKRHWKLRYNWKISLFLINEV